MTANGGVLCEAQDSGFIRLKKNNIIMCDPHCTVVDFKTEYKLTEEEIKSLECAEGVVNKGVFYVASAIIDGKQYDAD